jgi:tetratricopeptide (TPR) repeat protein
MSQVRAAWNAPAASFEKRAAKTRRSALELGIWNLDAAARSLVASGNARPSVEQAQAAVELAPDLPMARMALARVLWLQESSPIAAVRAIWGALAAIPRHLEASVWFAGIASYVLALALVCGGLICLAASAVVVVPHAAHDLGDAVSGEMPAFARVALLGAIAMFPMALGQGPLGAGLGLLAVAALYGSARQLWVLMLASGAVVLGLYPVAQLSGAALTAYSHDPVVEASYSATEGFATDVDRLRLERGAESDSLAMLALAVTERRSGNLAAADAHYQEILVEDSRNQAVLNNAANVRLNLGLMEPALELYRSASEVRDSPRILFNLSQAYGASFAVDELTETLAAAQRLDGEAVAELTRLQGSDQKSFTIDLPVDRRMLWERAYQSPAASELAAEFRSRFAPGWLGSRWWIALAAYVGVAIAASTASTRLRASHLCHRCGLRLCPRCSPEFAGGEICDGCTRLFHQPETTDRSLRLARMNVLRDREIWSNRVILLASILVPGSAGVFVKRHGWSLIGSVSAALAIAAIVFRNGVGVDPMVAGSTAPVVFGAVAALSVGTYALSVWVSLASGRRS